MTPELIFLNLLLKKIFENYFLEQEEIGASFAIYKEGKPLIDLWNGLKNKNDKNRHHYRWSRTSRIICHI